MAEAEAVTEGLSGLPSEVSLIGLVLNQRGLERALATRVDEVNFVVAASEGYSRANQGMSVDEAMAQVEAMIPVAVAAARYVTVTISVAFGDPYDGEVAIPTRDPGLKHGDALDCADFPVVWRRT